jgi:hypothetical protein
MQGSFRLPASAFKILYSSKMVEIGRKNPTTVGHGDGRSGDIKIMYQGAKALELCLDLSKVFRGFW